MACGTGKTLTALWITERLDNNTTLVLVPSLNLLSQTLTEWAHNTQRDWTYICVCSDETVNKEDDQPINTTVDLPYPVTTKPSEIAHFLKRRGRKIVFSTYQSSAQVAKAQKLSGKKFDLTICDEAHRLTGKTEADYATVLDEKKIISKKRLFMTATPRTYTATVKAKAEERGVEITSMDDPHIYGPQFHRLTFGEAIKQELLTDYQVVIVGVTDPQVQDLIDRRELVSVNDTVTTDARTLAAHIGLAKATKDFNLARTISFHSRIKTAAQFANDHPKILDWLPETHKPQGTTWTDTISGDMNTGQRRTLLQQLRKDQPGRHALLTNARCLTEGVDVPTLDGVAFIDPRSSQVDIIQAVGRAIRRSTSKTVGTIVLPVLIPEHVDPDEAMSDSAFKPIWSILNALKSHDQELSDSLDKLRTELGHRGSAGDLPHKIIEELPTDIDLLIPNFTAKLRLSIIDKTTSSWDHFYGLLLRFVEEFGHASPPKPKKGKDQLAGWVVGQRQKYRKRQLTQEEISKLESLPGWKWAVLEENWDEFFELLQQFAQEYGHAVVPQGSASRPYRGRNLASWVNSQRTKYGKGELSGDEISKLESVPGWVWNARSHQFQAGFEALQAYAAKYGTSWVERGTKYRYLNKEIDLRSWCFTIKAKKRSGQLSTSEIRSFDELPDWSWNNRRDDEFNEWLNLLKEFRKENGHALVALKSKYQEKALGSWVNSQRNRFIAGRLEPDRIRRLESIQGWSWRPHDDGWNAAYLEILNISRNLGSVTLLSGDSPRTRSLKGWINRQRKLFEEGSLPKDKIVELQKIPGWSWERKDINVEGWHSAIRKLRDYVSEFNEIPKRSVVYKGFKLGEWVKGRRTDYTARQISDERIAELEAIPGWTWDPFRDAWEQTYRRLSTMAEQSASGLPRTFSDKYLSGWILKQRKLYAAKTLEKDKQSKLQSLKGWRWSNDDLKNDEWTAMYAHLERFVNTNGHAKVRDKLVVDGVKLGTWVAVQRRRYTAGTITKSQVDLLQKLQKWSWNPIEDDWNDSFELLSNFAKRNRHCRIGKSTESSREIEMWIGVQRTTYRAGKLAADRKRKLESLPGWSWSPVADLWQTNYESLCEFVERHKRLPVKHNRQERDLGSWVSVQRTRYKRKTISKEQVSLLNSVPGWTWDPFADLWQWSIATLRDFVRREGHALVPSNHHENGLNLGSWINGVRTRHNRGQLHSDRVKELESIPGWTWNQRDAQWETNFRILERYVKKHGSAAVQDHLTFEGVALGKWVGKQRARRKRQSLEANRRTRLESLSGWMWDASHLKTGRTKSVPKGRRNQ